MNNNCHIPDLVQAFLMYFFQNEKQLLVLQVVFAFAIHQQHTSKCKSLTMNSSLIYLNQLTLQPI